MGVEILVVGATGRTGRHIVDVAVEQGLSVRAMARSAADRAWPTGVVPIGASVLDPEAVDRAIDGVDAVIVAISMVRTSDWPWAKILTPTDLHLRAAEILVAAAHARGVQRYASISAQGVGDSRARAGRLVMTLVRSSQIGVAYADLARAERVITGSSLDYVIARPTRLTQGPGTGRWKEGPALRTGDRASIPRVDVARFLVQAVQNGPGRRVLTLTT